MEFIFNMDFTTSQIVLTCINFIVNIQSELFPFKVAVVQGQRQTHRKLLNSSPPISPSSQWTVDETPALSWQSVSCRICSLGLLPFTFLCFLSHEHDLMDILCVESKHIYRLLKIGSSLLRGVTFREWNTREMLWSLILN